MRPPDPDGEKEGENWIPSIVSPEIVNEPKIFGTGKLISRIGI
jgi:hypothetical protein